MVKVVYRGYLGSAWVPAVTKAFERDVPTEVSAEDAEVLLSLPDFEKVEKTPKKEKEGEK